MKPRQLILFLIIVLAPLVLTAWLGVRYVRYQERENAERVRDAHETQLRGIDSRFEEYFRLLRQTVRPSDALSRQSTDAIRDELRNSPVVEQYFVLDGEGSLVYPSRGMVLSAREDQFLSRTDEMWTRGAFFASTRAEAGPADSGWYTWLYGSGTRMICWWRESGGTIAGAELNNARVLADMIAILPSAGEEESSGTAYYHGIRYALLDGSGNVVYEWGDLKTGTSADSVADIALSPPLQAWRLRSSSPPEVEASTARALYTSGVLALFAVSISVIAAWFYREQTRDLREAGQRVSFVNQVSHELKTPLTNIRMYAELLHEDLGEADEHSRKHLGVIVGESQRLSRLIGNVLTFSRGQHNTIQLHPKPGIPDETVAAVVEHFRPALEARGVRPSIAAGAGAPANFDPDALEQILGNLLSNVDKYAIGADSVVIQSSQTGSTLSVTVEDNGPGIPIRERARIFDAFHRVSNKLTDGVAGTGIGLTIARDLARLHGGDLVLEPAPGGARFEVTLRAPRAGA